jgi:pimeloyl-ACP methyl ester carboxylesterase
MNPKPIFKTADGEKAIMALYDDVLSRWPVPYSTSILPTRHGNTFIIISGEESAPPLFLFHGASTNATSWIGEVAQYSKYFRVHAIDIPGDPGKSAPNRPAYNSPGYTEWMEDVLNELKLDKVLLLGISQGGWTALKFATSRPERILKLVLLAPAGILPTSGSFLFKAVFFTLFGKWGAKKLNKIVFGKQPIHEDAIKVMNVIMTHFNARMEREYIFSDEELKRLKMPILLIGGTEDVIRPMDKIILKFKELVPQTETLLLPDSGHVLMNLAEKIVPFLLMKNLK